MKPTTRRWLVYAMAGVVSTALGALINIATNLMSSALAWSLVGVLTIAGIVVAAGVDRLRNDTERTPPAHAGGSPNSAYAAKGDAFVFNFNGGRNRVKVRSNSGATLALTGATVFVAVTAGMWYGGGTSADRRSGDEQASSPPPSHVATTEPRSRPSSADQSGGSCLIEHDARETERVPFTCSVEQLDWTCGQNTWIITKPPSEITEPMPLEAKRDGWRSWPAVADGAAGSGGRYQLTLQGKGSAAVVISGVTARVLARRPPLTGYALGRPCGGDGVFRVLDVDLDEEPPSLTPIFRPESATNAPHIEMRPIRFPYTIAIDDPENFLVAGFTSGCDCDWELELRWASQGATGKVRVNNNGVSFRNSSPSNSKSCTVLEYIRCR